jgi:hypothetical protein
VEVGFIKEEAGWSCLGRRLDLEIGVTNTGNRPPLLMDDRDTVWFSPVSEIVVTLSIDIIHGSVYYIYALSQDIVLEKLNGGWKSIQRLKGNSTREFWIDFCTCANSRRDFWTTNLKTSVARGACIIARMANMDRRSILCACVLPFGRGRAGIIWDWRTQLGGVARTSLGECGAHFVGRWWVSTSTTIWQHANSVVYWDRPRTTLLCSS